MKKSLLALKVLAAGGLGLLAGCAGHLYVEGPPVAVLPPPGQVVVTDAPPAPPAEVYVASPGPGYVWTPGYWSWQGRWVWIRGGWVVRPRAQVVWVPGRWHRHGHGYIWVGGYWR